MARIRSVLASALFVGFTLSAMPLFGQLGGVPNPGGPVLSPWLNLYNRSPGPVDNYHMYVQPAVQLQNTLQSQQMGIQHNAAAVNSVADQFTSQADAYYATATPTGNGATFMNQSRYFNNNGMGGAGVFGMPGMGGFGRPGGVGQYGTPGLGGAAGPGYNAPPTRGGIGQGMGRL
jgi:hypothetical protein